MLEAVEADRPPGGRVRVEGQDFGPELAEDGGHDERRRAEGVVEDDLEARRPDGARVDLVDQGLGVKVGDARRVDDVARLGGQAAAEVLPVKDPLDLALGHFGDVDAGRVDEAQDHGLRVVIGQADGDPSCTVLVAHAEPRHRHGRHFEVDHVGPGGVEAHYQRLLQDPGGAAGVPGNGDGGAPGHARGKGHGQAHRQFGGDVDIGEARDPVAPEQVARPPRLPHDRRVDDGAVLDRLEREHLDAGVHHGVLADEALVPQHHPLLYPGAPAQLAAATDRATPHPDAGAEVGIVMDHSALDEGVGTDAYVAAQYRVLPQGGARLHPAVVPDYCRAPQHGGGVDLGAIAQPDALAQAEARQLDLHAAVQDVLVRPGVRLQGADVLPVAVGHEPIEQRPLLAQQARENIGGKVHDAVGYEIEDPGLENVNAGVDGVRKNLAP